MPRATPALAFVYSGGPSNITGINSIGGQASTATGRYVASQALSGASVSGVTFLHAARNPLGAGSLSYVAASKTIQWTPNGGVVSQVGITADGTYTVGTAADGYLRFSAVYSALPTSDATQSVTVSDVMGSVFGTPTEGEMAAGFTDYRTLYLVNESASDAIDITLTLTDLASQSSLYLGSEFFPISQYATTREAAGRLTPPNPYTMTPIHPGMVTTLAPREKLGLTHPIGWPAFVFYPSAIAQDSDGVTDDLPLLLADRFDSTGMLSSVGWGASLYWPRIKAGRMVSFILKRVVPPNPTIPATETLNLDLVLTLT